MIVQALPGNWLDTGDNAWQLTAATFVGIMSIPGLALLYGGAVKKKWAVNSAFMVFYAFSAVLIVWVLWAYNMSFGKPWFQMPDGLGAFLGHPDPTTSAYNMEKEAIIPSSAAAMPALGYGQATMVYFQFVFAAITPIILLGAILGRVSFKAWVIFVPLWTTFIYSVGAYSLWGGGWLGSAGVVDYSGGYVIHLAAGTREVERERRHLAAQVVIRGHKRPVIFAVHAGIVNDHRYAGLHRPVHHNLERRTVRRRQTNGVYLSVDHRLHNLHFGGDICFGGRTIPD